MGWFALRASGVKRGNGAAIVVVAERRGLVDLAGEEAPAQRAVGDEANAKLLADRQHVRLRNAPPEGVLALDGRDRLDRMRAADGLGARL